MCGFIAIISKGEKPVSVEQLQRMSQDIIHRGPDDFGMWTQDWCGLAFRRLSILDLSEHGHQPMIDPTGEYVIVYNGEVYNYQSLRSHLQSEGILFSSTSDTEVVLQSYIRWGEECVSKFVGMFACIILHIPTRRIFIARDQLGIKPLYWTENRDFIFLASEIKAFRHAVAFSLNEASLYEQLLFRYVSGTGTPFKNIYKLLQGTYWRFEQGAAPQMYRYYNVTDSLKTKSLMSEQELLPRLEELLKESIRLHTASDVGYNIQLSGGVDSSFITAVLATDWEQQLDTFSITLQDREFDESQYQQMVVARYATRHHDYRLSDVEFDAALEKATWHMDIPIVHLGCVFLMVLCHESVHNSKVILTGEGADELFGGYSRYIIDKKTKLAQQLKRLGFCAAMFPSLPYFNGLKNRMNRSTLDSSLYVSKPDMVSFFEGIPENLHFRENTIRSMVSYRDQLFAHDQTCYLCSLLDRQDKMSMAASVEARVPFCNHLLFEMINPVPDSVKFRGNRTKSLLKTVAEHYLDASLLHRKKIGLVLPLGRWLRSGPLSERLSLLTDQTARDRGFYNHKNIVAAIDAHRQNRRDYGNYLSILIMFEVWMRMFIDDPFRYRGDANVSFS
ncbi:MAG: asparagine synthase (glutamine-hydrolyzing) [Candidatus Omnitrophota bacterium]|jgi:asparagine synthase (glutamine-hydrolysing)|nr:MAG: asparagine synthase (glutamine-hydrolyzing) [Candidatus Omnitrophota bacterium]